jgi:drug/metabolite transporter (DMT)-like permease
LQYLSPVLIAAHAVLFARKRLAFSGIAAIAGALSGCYLMVGGYRLDLVSMNRAGVISGLASAVAFAIYTVKSEHGMRSYASWTVVAYALAFAALFWNIFHPPLDAFAQAYKGWVWLSILFVGIFGTVFAFSLYIEGIRRISATNASVTAMLEPVSAGIIAYLFLGEAMEVLQVIGGALVIASIFLLQLRKAPE